MENNIRVRFAPSPTGPLHIGGVRTALYNYLFAKKHHGTFILRIEDTDQNRFVEGAEQYIVESLSWCGLTFDEGPGRDGPYAPYRQSERSAIYKKFIMQLVDSGHAYYAFDTEEELELCRSNAKSASNATFQYDQQTRRTLRNSLTLAKDEVERLIKDRVHHVIRVKIPENEQVVVHDIIRGEVVVDSANLDDKVLFKSDGLPTYHLANVVDDYLMKITHVIRGEEWLPSAPLHVLLYRFFGWEGQMPAFAHLPLILKPDGNGKLSKRDGDRLGFPVFPLAWKDPSSGELFSGYRESGYLPEAVLNIVAHLGWNPGTEQELFSLNELVEAFSLERVGKHGSKFDAEKARWFNHHYLSKASDETLTDFIQPYLKEHDISADAGYISSVLHLVKERAFLVPELWQHSWFFFKPPDAYDSQVMQKIWQPATGDLILAFLSSFRQIDRIDPESLHNFIADFVKEKGVKMGQIMNPLRLLTVGSNQGPGMHDIILTIGKEEFERRIETGLTRIAQDHGSL